MSDTGGTDDTDVIDHVEATKHEKKIAVIETFGPTIQGEGPLAGQKTMFIRFGGCDYRCAKCDSLHAVLPAAVKANATYLTPQEIADRIIPAAEATGTKYVTLSGGNPLMWDLSELVKLLHQAGLSLAVETQGTLWQDWVTACQMIVISPKAPGMGEKFEKDKFLGFLTKLHQAWEYRKVKHKLDYGAIALKVVVFSKQDIEFAIGVSELAKSHGKMIHPGLMFLSLGNETPPKLSAENTLEDQIVWSNHVILLLNSYRILVEEMVDDPRIHWFRFLPQLHVLLWGNEAEK